MDDTSTDPWIDLSLFQIVFYAWIIQDERGWVIPRKRRSPPHNDKGEDMTPEERLDRIETQIEKQNEGVQALIVVSRTVLTSMQELRNVQHEIIEEMRERDKATQVKLNILVDTVDRIIRNKDNKH